MMFSTYLLLLVVVLLPFVTKTSGQSNDDGSGSGSGSGSTTEGGDNEPIDDMVECYVHECSSPSWSSSSCLDILIEDAQHNDSITIPTCQASYCKLTYTEQNFVGTFRSECWDTDCGEDREDETSTRPKKVISCCQSDRCNRQVPGQSAANSLLTSSLIPVIVAIVAAINLELLA